MNDKYKFISAIIELVCAVVLLGISVYYLIKEDTSAFLLFLIVGIVCIIHSVRIIYKRLKQDKDKKDKN